MIPLLEFTEHILDDLHPILSHFPIAIFVLVVLLSFASRRYASFREMTWVLLVCGVLFAIPSAATGIIAHFPYEETALVGKIDQHLFLGLGTTLFFFGLTVWRWSVRRRGRDNGASWPFLGSLLVGLVLLTLLGGTGGSLVYDHGVNVRAVNPLLKQSAEPDARTDQRRSHA